MADTLVYNGVLTNLNTGDSLWGPYWVNSNEGVIIAIDSASDPNYYRTTNGGVNWGRVTITANVRNVCAWFDQETPGDSGNLVHFIMLDNGLEDFNYRTINVDTGSLGTARKISDTVGISSVPQNQKQGITKTRSGNLIAVYSTQSELAAYKSDDNGVTWNPITTPFETTTEEDWILLFPANTGDDNDACAIFWDRSANAISIKMYDDSEDTWTETAIASSMVDDTVFRNMDAAIRHSDGHILLVAHSDADSAGDDLRTWDLTVDSIASPTVTAKTNVNTNLAESIQTAIMIDQNTDDVYVAYIYGSAVMATVNAYFKKSTNGMTSWGSELNYGEATDDDLRDIAGGRSIKSGNSGKIQWAFFNDDLDDIFVNLVNDIDIEPVSGAINPKIKIAGVFFTKTTNVKIGGTFAEKIMKVKVGGTFQ